MTTYEAVIGLLLMCVTAHFFWYFVAFPSSIAEAADAWDDRSPFDGEKLWRGEWVAGGYIGASCAGLWSLGGYSLYQSLFWMPPDWGVTIATAVGSACG